MSFQANNYNDNDYSNREDEDDLDGDESYSLLSPSGSRTIQQKRTGWRRLFRSQPNILDGHNNEDEGPDKEQASLLNSCPDLEGIDDRNDILPNMPSLGEHFAKQQHAGSDDDGDDDDDDGEEGDFNQYDNDSGLINKGMHGDERSIDVHDLASVGSSFSGQQTNNSKINANNNNTGNRRNFSNSLRGLFRRRRNVQEDSDAESVSLMSRSEPINSYNYNDHGYNDDDEYYYHTKVREGDEESEDEEDIEEDDDDVGDDDDDENEEEDDDDENEEDDEEEDNVATEKYPPLSQQPPPPSSSSYTAMDNRSGFGNGDAHNNSQPKKGRVPWFRRMRRMDIATQDNPGQRSWKSSINTVVTEVVSSVVAPQNTSTNFHNNDYTANNNDYDDISRDQSKLRKKRDELGDDFYITFLELELKTKNNEVDRLLLRINELERHVQDLESQKSTSSDAIVPYEPKVGTLIDTSPASQMIVDNSNRFNIEKSALVPNDPQVGTLIDTNNAYEEQIIENTETTNNNGSSLILINTDGNYGITGRKQGEGILIEVDTSENVTTSLETNNLTTTITPDNGNMRNLIEAESTSNNSQGNTSSDGDDHEDEDSDDDDDEEEEENKEEEEEDCDIADITSEKAREGILIDVGQPQLEAPSLVIATSNNIATEKSIDASVMGTSNDTVSETTGESDDGSGSSNSNSDDDSNNDVDSDYDDEEEDKDNSVQECDLLELGSPTAEEIIVAQTEGILIDTNNM